MFSPWAYLLPLGSLVVLIAGVVRLVRAASKQQRMAGVGMIALGAVVLVLFYSGQHVNTATWVSR